MTSAAHYPSKQTMAGALWGNHGVGASNQLHFCHTLTGIMYIYLVLGGCMEFMDLKQANCNTK